MVGVTRSQAGEEQRGIKAKPDPKAQSSGSDPIAVCHVESKCLKPMDVRAIPKPGDSGGTKAVCWHFFTPV